MDDAEPKSKRIPFVTHPLLTAGSYVVGIGAGIATASFKIWDKFYSKMKHTDLISPLSEQRYKDINAVYDAAKTHSIPYEEYAGKISAIEKDYSHKVNALLKDTIHIETEGVAGAIKGTWQRFKTLGPYTQSNIAFTGAATIGTTLGAYFLINQNLRLKHELSNVHDRLDEPASR